MSIKLQAHTKALGGIKEQGDIKILGEIKL